MNKISRVYQVGYDYEMPSPTDNEINDISFQAIWEVIKDWDINVPEYYTGYCGGNGSHVKLIYDKLNDKKCLRNRKQKLEKLNGDSI
jgi:hypothetical protein